MMTSPSRNILDRTLNKQNARISLIDWLVLNIILGAFNDGFKLMIDNAITTEKVHNKNLIILN